MQQIQTKLYIEKNFAALTKQNEENAAEEEKKTHYHKHDKKHHLKDPENFSKEIDRRLDFIEKDYIKKKIKLLNVKEQLKHI